MKKWIILAAVIIIANYLMFIVAKTAMAVDMFNIIAFILGVFSLNFVIIGEFFIDFYHKK